MYWRRSFGRLQVNAIFARLCFHELANYLAWSGSCFLGFPARRSVNPKPVWVFTIDHPWNEKLFERGVSWFRFPPSITAFQVRSEEILFGGYTVGEVNKLFLWKITIIAFKHTFSIFLRTPQSSSLFLSIAVEGQGNICNIRFPARFEKDPLFNACLEKFLHMETVSCHSFLTPFVVFRAGAVRLI